MKHQKMIPKHNVRREHVTAVFHLLPQQMVVEKHLSSYQSALECMQGYGVPCVLIVFSVS